MYVVCRNTDVIKMQLHVQQKSKLETLNFKIRNFSKFETLELPIVLHKIGCNFDLICFLLSVLYFISE